MSSTFYLPRRLLSNDEIYTETGLLAASNYVVVLAEPGGGKTELLRSLAQQLSTSIVTANVFAHVEACEENCPLVVDAFDELAKVDQSGINKLLANASMANPTHVIISSRSSEWDSASTNAFNDFLGHSPLVIRLCEFDETEQRLIFESHLPGEDFAAFQAEVARFDLEKLLPNPQFLKLFADAYIESERHFADKRSIFVQAVNHLTKESNTHVARVNPALSTSQKVNFASEVFAKLLLSGAEGINTSEANQDRLYPQIQSLFSNNTAADGILATQLFKPGDSADKHRPVHKIVAEYCAAGYLTKRITNPSDPLTLPKCLPIIAPNSTVRDELRGLLGWMASLGNKPVEETAIELDPYAVLSNGDPSQLEHSSKRLLVKRLKEIETNDPYFRRGDFGRRFSTAGFFTQEVIEEIEPLLATGGDGHFRNLILELLAGSAASEQFRDELRQLALKPGENENTRLLANRCLLNISDHDHVADLEVLISEASNTSLSIAADSIENLGPETLGREHIADFLRNCANLYPSRNERRERVVGTRYFVKRLIIKLDLATIKYLLDEIAKDLTCTCGKESYSCICRNGKSKVVGSMLDRYFELEEPPHDPKRIWQWVKNLNFHNHMGLAVNIKSVNLLQKDDNLRQGILKHTYLNVTERKQISNTITHMRHSHDGLQLQAKDRKYLVDLAYKTNNPNLWVSFLPPYDRYRWSNDRASADLRRQMRKQALEKPSFMREWARSERATLQFEREHRMRPYRATRSMKRRRRQLEETREANIEFVQENRELIESGRHWGYLSRFANLALDNPEEIGNEIGDEDLARNALRNCLDFIAPNIPDLQGLAKLRFTSEFLQTEKDPLCSLLGDIAC